MAAAAAIAAALILDRKPAPPPLPDRVQLTLTGNAIAPSLSLDGTRLAFAEKQCDTVGDCTYQLVIQEIDGSGRPLVLASNIGYIFETRWISAGLLQFGGSYPPLRSGAFAVSTLGGEPRYLGCCFFSLVSGDTAFTGVGVDKRPGADRGWVRRITVHDGQTLDSVPVRDQGAFYGAIGLTIPDRLIVGLQKTRESATEMRLTDFRGQVISQFTSPWSLDRCCWSRWVPSKQKLILGVAREPAGTELDILSMTVTASGIDPHIDTVFSGLQMAGPFDISADGERLVYAAGPVETTLSMIEIDRTVSSRLPPTQVFPPSTTLLRGRISPSGDKIFLARDAPRAGAHASQFSIIPRTGGAEWQLPGAVENLLDFQWSPDGTTIMYLHGIGGNRIRLIEKESTGRVTRDTTLEQSAATQFDPLPDGAVCLIPADRHSISIIRRPGKRDVTWPVPNRMTEIFSISHSPDAKSVAVEGMSPSLDSVVVATVDIETGTFTRVGTFAGSDPQKVMWLEDGSIMSVFREPQGAWALYRIRPGRRAERLRPLPHTRADFSISNDGRHVAMFSYTDKNDVYMIRNFGQMLRR